MTDNFKLKFQRFEMKYEIPEWLVSRIVNRLLCHMELDSYVRKNGNENYPVTSLYFDSIGLRCYREKMAGLRNREKIRLRVYGENFQQNMPVFAEIKKKKDAVVLKDRFVIPYSQYARAIKLNRFDGLEDFLSLQEKEIFDEFLWMHRHGCFVPKIVVAYSRKPLMGRADPRLRVTFDSNIACCPYPLHPRNVRLVAPNRAVMEIKYNNTIPYWLHDVIRECNLERTAFSKYCRSVEAAIRNYGFI